MPYNTRRKSLSLPSLGIHIPVTHAARAAAAAAAAAASSASTSNRRDSSTPASSKSHSSSESVESHPSKRQKKSHGSSLRNEQTPPPSPSPDFSTEMSGVETTQEIDFESIHDDIVEAVITQLLSTANRPHLVKELATVLSQRLTVVQHSANPCAIISSRLAAYLKRPCWSAPAPCPLAKELETVHPRRTYFFLTTCPRQPLPEANAAIPSRRALDTPSVSLTDDSTSDDADSRRRELSPSPEVDLSPEFEDGDEDVAMPITPIGSLPSHRPQRMPTRRDQRRNSPPLEKDEREFTQTANGLLKRKLHQQATDPIDRNGSMEYGYRDDSWFGDHLMFGSTTFIGSPSMNPNVTTNYQSGPRKEDEAESWLKLSKLLEWDRPTESIEIDELDGLFDSC